MKNTFLTPQSLQLNTGSPLYLLDNVCKEYEGSTEKVIILREVTLTISPGETISIMGSSGSGKSSLLHILGSLASPSSGKVFFLGQDMALASSAKKAALRSAAIGFVFQFHHLLPEFTTLENIAMPAIIAGMKKEQAFDQAREVINQVGLRKRESYNVTLLSGGERQRAAIARAILRKPLVLLADEPTGNLDEKNGQMVADLLLELNTIHKMAMVVVTHNPELAARTSKCFELKSGDLYDQTC